MTERHLYVSETLGGTILGTASVIQNCWEGGTWHDQLMTVTLSDVPFGGTPKAHLFLESDYAWPNGYDGFVYSSDIDALVYGKLDIAPSEGEEVPTSTYSGFQASDFIVPGWSNDAVIASSSDWTQHVEGYIGPATDTFPLCFAYPFWGLLDTVQGSMVTGTTEGITFQGGFLQGNTTTLTLESAPGVLAATGFRRIEDLALPWIEAMAWTVFGVFVFLKLFGKGETDDSVTDETT